MVLIAHISQESRNCPLIGRLVRAIALLVGLLALQSVSALEPPGLVRGFDRGQLLVSTSRQCTLIDVFVARTNDQRAQGLMFVERMDAYEGMLFVYQGSAMLSMWMKNTLLPLDMLFAGPNGEIVHIHRDARPYSTDIISSMEPVSLVVELNAGMVDRLGISTGDRIVFPAG
jgi:uncharacterized membrane protein (UPF0127 family)